MQEGLKIDRKNDVSRILYLDVQVFRWCGHTSPLHANPEPYQAGAESVQHWHRCIPARFTSHRTEGAQRHAVLTSVWVGPPSHVRWIFYLATDLPLPRRTRHA